MAATPSVVVVKTFTFRGVARKWSNRYHFNGGTPANTAAWTTLFDAITTAERVCTSSACQIVEAIGYAAGSDVPVATKTYSLTGSHIISADTQAGEVCALVRYSTAARTSKNHPIYLFNYYHSVGTQVAPAVDTLEASHQTAFLTYANDWVSPGFSDGTNNYTRAGPNGASAVGAIVESMVTHRDFPR